MATSRPQSNSGSSPEASANKAVDRKMHHLSSSRGAASSPRLERYRHRRLTVRDGARAPPHHEEEPCRSLKRHVDAFRNVGAETGADDNAASHLLRGVVAGPHRVAAGPENR